MKKSKIVSYTSDERQMADESDWAAADAMTDEEIEAAIASDPEEAEMHQGWMQRATVVRAKPRFVMCIANANKDNKVRLTLRRVYKVIPDEEAAARQMIRVVDDTGEAYLFPASSFVPVQLSVEAELNFDKVIA